MLTSSLLRRRIVCCISSATMLVCTGVAQDVELAELQENRPVGTWTDYLPYHQTEEVVHCGSELDTGFWAVRTEHAVFTVDERSNAVERISTVQGMSGSQPTALAWDPIGELLIVGQASGTIDFFSNTGDWLYTLRDIQQSNLIGDKSILSLQSFGAINPDLLLATTAFGVVAIHLRELDVRDTWYLEGQQTLRRCYGMTVNQDHYVVWTDAGVFEAPVDHGFLSSPEAWTRWDDIPLETATYVHVEFTPMGDVLLHRKTGVATTPDELWLLSEGLWQPFEASESAQVLAIASGSIGSDVGDWRIAIADHQSIRQFNSEWEEIQLDYAADGVPLRVRDMAYRHAVEVMGDVGIIEFGDLFIANFEQGLLKMDVSGGEADAHWSPEGPPVALVRDVDAWNDQVWVASGGIDETWTSMYHKHGLYGVSGTRWNWIPNEEGLNDLTGLNDPMVVSIDPTDPYHAYFGSWEEGLIEVYQGAIVAIYNDSNSTLELGDFGGSPRIGVGGLDFDARGNLWFSNAFAEKALHVRLKDGSFHAMALGNALGNNGWLGDVLAARNGYIWCIMPRGQGLLVYDTNNTPSTTEDDDWRILTTDPDKGGLPSDDIHSLEEDLDGEIWIGTAAGPCVVYLPSAVFDDANENPVASQILIQQDGNYQLLLETEVVESICIDGGNRKWIGTQNSGAYLLSPDGITQVAHFTAENSPLLSNQVTDIAINHRNGEVLIGTQRGLMGWRGDASNFTAEIGTLRVYPNPVEPGFDGWVTLEGLAYNSTVHITTLSGRAVATVTSEGGRAVWDARDFNGDPVPYGVYMLFATDATGASAGVAKLAVTR
jgi:hypothetical protein